MCVCVCGTVWCFGEVTVQRGFLWWLCDFLGGWGSECAAGGFVVGLEQFGVFGEVTVQRVFLW